MNPTDIGQWVEDILRRHLNSIPAHDLRTGSYKGDASAAIFSICGLYRYVLVRIWDPKKPMWLFAMLNPSVASEQSGDPTVDRQVERAKRHGAGGIIVINAGGLVETDRKAAIKHADPIGPDNEALARAFVEAADKIIAAYGADACRFGGEMLLARLLHGRKVMALRKTKKGYPGHPLYIAYAQPLIPFTMPAI